MDALVNLSWGWLHLWISDWAIMLVGYVVGDFEYPTSLWAIMHHKLVGYLTSLAQVKNSKKQ